VGATPGLRWEDFGSDGGAGSSITGKPFNLKPRQSRRALDAGRSPKGHFPTSSSKE